MHKEKDVEYDATENLKLKLELFFLMYILISY